MWDGCVLTKLAGTVDAASMTEDIRFRWEPFKALQSHYFTQYGARCVAVILFALVIGGWNILSMLDYAKGRVQPRGFNWYFVKRVVPGIVLGVIGAAGCFAIVPKLGNDGVHVSRGPRGRSDWFPRILRSSLEDSPDVLGRTDSEIAAFLRTKGGEWGRNVVTGSELEVADSPGNFTVERKGEQVLVRVYDRIGRAVVETFPVGAKSDRSQPGHGPSSDRRSQR
jgi:hypothetical protein